MSRYLKKETTLRTSPFTNCWLLSPVPCDRSTRKNTSAVHTYGTRGFWLAVDGLVVLNNRIMFMVLLTGGFSVIAKCTLRDRTLKFLPRNSSTSTVSSFSGGKSMVAAGGGTEVVATAVGCHKLDSSFGLAVVDGKLKVGKSIALYSVSESDYRLLIIASKQLD